MAHWPPSRSPRHHQVALVFVCLEFHHPTPSLPSPGSSASPTPSSRVTVHPHLIGEKEFDIFLSKAHLVVRMIQLKMGQDLLLQVTRGITLQLVALISEISGVTHPPFLPHSFLSSLTPSLPHSLLFSLPSLLPPSLAGVPQATNIGVYCQSDKRVWTLASPPHLNRRGKKITLVARILKGNLSCTVGNSLFRLV